MRQYSIVILSRNLDNLKRCIGAVMATCTGAPPRVIVVWDGDDLPGPTGIKVLRGAPEFCYSVNANIGIRAAGTDDVVLLNDDAIVLTQGGLDKLSSVADHFGIVSPLVKGRCGRWSQRWNEDRARVVECRAEPEWVAFVCVYIAREVLNRIGLLDERFLKGNWEDNDFCKRSRLAGVQLGIYGAVTIDHDSLPGTFAACPDYSKLLKENSRLFAEKWSPYKIHLSICVCSILSRGLYLQRLLARLNPQLSLGVEFLLSVDSGQVTIGAKRQRMMEAARGDYLVFLDDDDLIHPEYVEKVLAAIRGNPGVDCITYKAKRYVDGAFESDFVYTLATKANQEVTTEKGIRTRNLFPYHITPIRREVARKVKFPRLDWLEDTMWAEALRPFLATEVHLDEYLYEYLWRTDRGGEETHKVRVEGRKTV